ncbi:hypothetical protein FN960_04980 [Alkalicoccobacillus porphyridii]|uniref:Uncharacterized protein n=1 Tax=Alkalicoccobacillus porphyridii TaxID=2597270 RepID=A0A554A2P9_9BACI|nr:hypothetical protein FN960_04980 [Alkalicoccobacillus porphyridii]
MLKQCTVSLLAVLLLSVPIVGGVPTAEATTYTPKSYNYSYWGDSVPSPEAYSATNLVDGESLGVGAFAEPSDMHVTENLDIYILDTGNNRVVVLNEQLELIHEIDSFSLDGQSSTFANPRGIFVNNDDHIFIADSGNRRVVHLDQNLELVKIIDNPESELLGENFTFTPVKVVVDFADRVFVMADGVFDGFMEFSVDGQFTTFIGANRVRVDPIEYIWKRFATREQRSQMVMYVPTEFTSLDIDERGFVYATNADNSEDVIKKINARGDDILRREGYFSPFGDVLYTRSSGPSRLVDISVADSEIYSVLDARRGRIFTYNGDGHLMYVFGGLGNKVGEFHTPIAIERSGDQFLVLDRELGEISIFAATEYGQTLNEAVRSYESGDEERAQQLYSEAVQMNMNLEFAYTGIGKALLRQDDYEAAMNQFERSLDQTNYSKAYLLFRNQELRQHFSFIMTGVFILVVGFTSFVIYRRSTKRNRGVSV